MGRHVALGIVAEDDEARRVASAAAEAQQEPRFAKNNGPFVEVWFGKKKLFGLIECAAPNDFIQVACEADDHKSHDNGSAATTTNGAAAALRVTDNVSFVLRLASVPHATLPVRARREDPFVNSVDLVVEYAALLRRGMRDEFAGADADAEYVRFTDAA
ncbi:hypothetical protein DQ04_09321010 [Trypanosoma grayi]|uniref:hypothetical protein n=1 Tax=Trypanosoma grayi TaxID=71804 RepID=UPI0004F4A077|nr:hypothetical protein DQ04_09321010 [Trypanosoma grayi]KEG07595.1 hypothetical protein DQ04_09321010 [Trypanosoma grayi]